MDKIELYSHENSELADFEALSRGYRQVYASKGNEVFLLHIYDIVRLKQDFETELESNGFFGIEPNIILVKEVTLNNIAYTLERLNRQSFFESLKSIEIGDVHLERLVI
jgi:hypothetical protein